MKIRFIITLVALFTLIMLMMPLVAIDRISIASSSANKILDEGEIWIVKETTRLSGLTIADGAAITAPKGYSVTLTVGGIETGIKPGDYRGKIVLKVTKTSYVNNI